MGRPETDRAQRSAMTILGNALADANYHEDALSVDEARLSMLRRVGASENDLLTARGNLTCSYERLGRHEEALSLRQEIYSGRLKLNGEEHLETLRAAYNYALSLARLERFEEAKALLRKKIPVARRVCGESHDLALRIGWTCAYALCRDPSATLDDLREAVTALEELERTARRVLGGAHPTTVDIERALKHAQATLFVREKQSSARP